MARAEHAAVVVSWEGGDATRRCVESLLAETPGPDLVIVVDNASGADERDALRGRWGDVARVRLVLLTENRHFAGGMNVGARLAGRSSASCRRCRPAPARASSGRWSATEPIPNG